ncbi:hypothetical protein JM78_19415 [Burkholderia pyrrocinia]|nr:hypothetical protein JM78_19415 [Burkholderia pyrrocinia]
MASAAAIVQMMPIELPTIFGLQNTRSATSAINVGPSPKQISRLQSQAADRHLPFSCPSAA